MNERVNLFLKKKKKKEKTIIVLMLIWENFFTPGTELFIYLRVHFLDPYDNDILLYFYLCFFLRYFLKFLHFLPPHVRKALRLAENNLLKWLICFKIQCKQPHIHAARRTSSYDVKHLAGTQKAHSNSIYSVRFPQILSIFWPHFK